MFLCSVLKNLEMVHDTGLYYSPQRQEFSNVLVSNQNIRKENSKDFKTTSDDRPVVTILYQDPTASNDANQVGSLSRKTRSVVGEDMSGEEFLVQDYDNGNEGL